MKRVFSLIFLAMIFLTGTAFAQVNKPLSQEPNVKAFMNHMVKKYHFNKQDLIKWFSTVHVVQESNPNTMSHNIVHRMKHQQTFTPWYQYKKLFINDSRIIPGIAYWKKNQKWLDKANTMYGVPQSIIVATIGVESKYGEQMGAFPIFKALSTLAFQYSKRNGYFTKELIAYLLYCKHNDISPLTIMGSYAGAIGQPQFMPQSLNLYAVDFDGKGKVSLIHSSADAIGSVGNFYHKNHWSRNEPVAVPAVLKGPKPWVLFKKNPLPSMTLKKFASYGITPKETIKDQNLPATLIALKEKGNKKQYWLAFHNFDVIKNYNNSTNYAMSIYLLSQTLRQKYDESLKQ
jgi:membrane-bound lytic murein transglycosylase B